jgi:fructokinase
MVSSGALAKRRNIESKDLATLSDEDTVWDACAHYLAGLCVTLSLTLSPERIVLGGGVMQRECLFPKTRERVRKLLAGYMSLDELVTDDGLATFIVPSQYGNDAGLMGALFLADNALCN